MSEITEHDIRDLLYGQFTEYAKDEGLSMEGEPFRGGFMFYSMETKKAFNHFSAGYVIGAIK